jgi:hypothetical protein
MFAAFVVSVVADAASPETAAEVMAMLVGVTPDTCPCALVVITGTVDAEPYVPAVPIFAEATVSTYVLLAISLPTEGVVETVPPVKVAVVAFSVSNTLCTVFVPVVSK